MLAWTVTSTFLFVHLYLPPVCVAVVVSLSNKILIVRKSNGCNVSEVLVDCQKVSKKKKDCQKVSESTKLAVRLLRLIVYFVINQH